jgi:3-hydroxyisobutyrate dehydrogenase-like beta-hydroxyacid dehydrogenase
MEKDLRYAIDEATAHGVDLSTAGMPRQLFERAIARGWADADMAAVIEAVRG